MADARTGQAIAWVAAGLLVLLLALSLTGNGTFLGGMAMGWMMAIPLLLLLVAVWAAYRFGRMEAKVEDLERDRKAKP